MAAMANDPDSPTVVTTARNEAEAALMVSHLESVGIKARIAGAQTQTAFPYVPCDIQVVVRQADLERAREALEDVGQDADEPG
jgi:hypothetical protein